MSKFSQGSKQKNKSEIIKKLSIHHKPELQNVNAQIIVNWTLKYLIEQMNDVIDEAEQKIYIDRMLIPASMSLKYMNEMLCPEEHQREIAFIANDREPQRVSFDPICGFDRLVTYSKTKETIPRVKRQKNTSKQIPSYKNLKKNHTTDVSSTQKGEKLIPLTNLNLTIQKESQEAEIVQRDRRLYETRNYLMPSLQSLIHIPKTSDQSQKIKSVKATKHFLESSTTKHEEYVYGYNGEKEVLLTGITRNFGSNHFGGNQILKASYKINESVSKKKEDRGSMKKDMEIYKRISKDIRRDTMNMMTRRATKANIDRREAPNILKILAQSSSNDQGRVKTILENQFKKSLIEKVKWREKPERSTKYS